MRRPLAALLIATAIAACSAPGGAHGPTTAGPSGAGASSSVSTSTTDGPFRLEIVMPKASWTTGEVITGSSTLSIADASAATVSGSGGGVTAFSYDQVDGPHHTGYGQTSDCVGYPISPTAPITQPLSKSGGFGAEDPDVDFMRSFLLNPEIHLPPGTWDVTAIAMFVAAPMCGGDQHEMRATVRITVTG